MTDRADLADLAAPVPLRLDGVRAEPLDGRHLNVPAVRGATVGDAGSLGWTLDHLLLPTAVLRRDAVAHNVELMAGWCARHRVSIAPHGKTTMSPQLLELQRAAGAWAITAATVGQARLFVDHGVRRILVANEVVDTAGLRWLRGALDADPDLSLFVLVDSVRGVALADAALQGAARPLAVLVERGFAGGRTGCRSHEIALEVAQAARAADYLVLAGVESFEGVLHADSHEATRAGVDRHLDDVCELAQRLDALGLFADRDEVVLSAGGSVHFDQVAATFSALALSRPTRVVVRSGCYLSHDSGHFDEISPFGAQAPPSSRLRPALEVWGAVLSTPEPGLAFVGLGKRDAGHDLRLPTPLAVRRDGIVRPVAEGTVVFELNDQHAYVSMPPGELEVGDLLGCGISHPCTTFDRWPLIPVVDDGYRVVDAVRTFF